MLNEARERWRKGGNANMDASNTISHLVNAQVRYLKLILIQHVLFWIFFQSGQGGDSLKAQGQTELIRAQHLEKMDLEKEILAGEKNKLDEFMKIQDDAKAKELKLMSDKLAFKLQGELTEKEVFTLIEFYNNLVHDHFNLRLMNCLRHMNVIWKKPSTRCLLNDRDRCGNLKNN